MKIFVALAMGFLSGLLIYLMGSFTFLDLYTPANTRLAFGFVTIFGGWAASSYLLLRGAETTINVLSRGFLLGAAEWLLMIGVGFIKAGKMFDLSRPESSIASGGIVAGVLGAISLAMAIACLAGFAIVHFWRRQQQAKQESFSAHPRP